MQFYVIRNRQNARGSVVFRSLAFLFVCAILLGCSPNRHEMSCGIPELNFQHEVVRSDSAIGPIHSMTLSVGDKYPSTGSVSKLDSILVAAGMQRYSPAASEVTGIWSFFPSSFGPDSGKTIAQYSLSWRSSDESCLVTALATVPSEGPFPDSVFLNQQELYLRWEKVVKP